MNIPKYTCGKCGISVIVVPNEKPLKACKCKAPIVANMEATVIRNTGGIKG